MNPNFQQLYAIPPVAWDVALMIVGVIVYAVAIDGGSPKQALTGLLVGVFGGGVIILLVKAKAPELDPYFMAALSAMAGLFGNWFVHFVYDRRNLLGDFIERYLKSKYDNIPPRNPSQEDKQP